MAQAANRVLVSGPFFEDFEPGQVFDDAPALTLTSGHAALHQALTGDRLRLALDAPLSLAVTGRDALLAHPNLVCDVAIGQSTGPTQRVKGNLFARTVRARTAARPVSSRCGSAPPISTASPCSTSGAAR